MIKSSILVIIGMDDVLAIIIVVSTSTSTSTSTYQRLIKYSSLCQRVSVNLYDAATPGRLPNTFGKKKIESQFTGKAIFVDHASRYISN